MNLLNIDYLLKPQAARQICLEIESYEKRIKRGEIDGIPRSEITLLWMETVTRKDQYRNLTGLAFENVCEVTAPEKKFLGKLFADLHGYAWSLNYGWIGQAKTLTRNAVDILEASAPLYHGIQCSSHRSEYYLEQSNATGFVKSETKGGNRRASQHHNAQPSSLVIKGIDLHGIGCDGMITNSGLNSLTSCETFDLSLNIISGELPPNLASLKSLIHLNLSCNQIRGEINPRILSNLVSLVTLDLSFNCLTGPVPADCWETLPQLETLNLSSNQLSGEVPDSISCLTNLRSLKLYSNGLCGAIPAALSSLQQLRFANLSQNLFTAGINAFNHCTRLEQLQLNDNLLRGHIDSSVSQLQKLDLLYLFNNKISGVLTNSICELSSLRYVNLSNNMLRGVIPQDIGNMTRLESLLLHDNSLVGPVPLSLGKLQKLRDFYVFKPYQSESSSGTRALNKTAFERIMVFGPSLGIDSMHWDFARVYGRERDARDDDSVTLFSKAL